MRIAFLTNNAFPPREGIGRHIFEVGTRLRQLGHEPVIISAGRTYCRWSRFECGGLRVHAAPYPPVRPFHQQLLKRHLDNWFHEHGRAFDLVHAHLPLLPPLDTRLPIVATFHTPMLTDTAAIGERDLKAKLIKLNARMFSVHLEDWYLQVAHNVVTVSTAVARELATYYQLGGRQPAVVPNGVDAERFGFAPLDGRNGSVLFVGRLGYRKGLPRLLRAIALLGSTAGSTGEPRLLLAGEGPLRARLQRLANELGIADRVEFLGFLDRESLSEQLLRASCFVSPSDYEGAPLTMLEAMASGTPVVTTPIGAISDLGANPPVLVCDKNDRSLATAIDRVLTEPAHAAAMATAARHLVEQQFSWDMVVERLLDIYAPLQRRRAA